MQTQILLYDGADDLDAIAPFGVLRSASEIRPDFLVELAAVGLPGEVTTSRGLKLRASARLSIDSPPDLLIVPGGGWVARAARGAYAEARRGELPAAIAELHRSGRTLLASVCTGAMLLAAAGILRGRHATTNRSAVAELAKEGAQIVRARVVDDGDIVTSGGVTSGLDLALWLVERLIGPAVASAIEERFEYERRGTVWRAAPEAPRRGPIAFT